MADENVMRTIRLEKATVNIGAGKEQSMLEKGIKLIKSLTGKEPVKTITNKRIPTWGLRPGIPIGCKLTLRGKEAEDILKRMLSAKSNTLSAAKFDNEGNVSFGVPEYIDIEGSKYDPEVGIIGLQISATLTRPGFRLKNRKVKPKTIPKQHRITKEEAIKFMKDKFNIKIEEEEQEE